MFARPTYCNTGLSSYVDLRGREGFTCWHAQRLGAFGSTRTTCRRGKVSVAHTPFYMAAPAVLATSNSRSAIMGFGPLSRKSGRGSAIAKRHTRRSAPIAPFTPTRQMTNMCAKIANAAIGPIATVKTVAAQKTLANARPCPAIAAVHPVRHLKRASTSTHATVTSALADATARRATQAAAIAADALVAKSDRRVA